MNNRLKMFYVVCLGAPIAMVLFVLFLLFFVM